jgi:hypothetical protein
VGRPGRFFLSIALEATWEAAKLQMAALIEDWGLPGQMRGWYDSQRSGAVAYGRYVSPPGHTGAPYWSVALQSGAAYREYSAEGAFAAPLGSAVEAEGRSGSGSRGSGGSAAALQGTFSPPGLPGELTWWVRGALLPQPGEPSYLLNASTQAALAPNTPRSPQHYITLLFNYSAAAARLPAALLTPPPGFSPILRVTEELSGITSSASALAVSQDAVAGIAAAHGLWAAAGGVGNAPPAP